MNKPARRAARLLAVSLAALSAGVAEARVVSYAPVTQAQAIPAVQKRTSRHYLLIEQTWRTLSNGIAVQPCGSCWYQEPWGRLVLHDSRGEEDPRVVFPPNGQAAFVVSPALWEGPEGIRLFVSSRANLGDNAAGDLRHYYSPDGGSTWKVLPLASNLRVPSADRFLSGAGGVVDYGGPLALGAGSQIRPGSADVPFVVSLATTSYPVTADNVGRIWAINADGTVRNLAAAAHRPGSSSWLPLLGTDREGKKFLFLGSPASANPSWGWGLYTVDLLGQMSRVLDLLGVSAPRSYAEGWITPDGGVYVYSSWDSSAPPPSGFAGNVFVGYFKGGVGQMIAAPALPSSPSQPPGRVFAVPTADYAGAWVLHQQRGAPTRLLLHTPSAGLVEQWSDPTGPQVEALHAGVRGDRLLVQVHRPRPLPDQRTFIDPALAIWKVGTPAPAYYDELYLNEQVGKGFVHLDVDALEDGDPFVFDTSIPILITQGGPSGGPGGSGGVDVSQEWGVVRGSLRQRLVVPAVARAPGAKKSLWVTDVILRNPSSEMLNVNLEFIPQREDPAQGALNVTLQAMARLAPKEIRPIADVLGTLWGIERAAGVLHLAPEGDGAVEATSRTYTAVKAADGSYAGTLGMGVPAVDVYASASPRYPLSYAGGLQGIGFRTNVMASDLTGRGSQISLSADGPSGATPLTDSSFQTPPGGQAQVNGIASYLRLPAGLEGAVVVRPTTGQAVTAISVIDEKTNAPTYFPPDVPAPFLRTIPALVHRDGAEGAVFRSDLFLYNPSDGPRTVRLLAKAWDLNEPEKQVSLSLGPRESRVVRDALPTLFGKEGVARLRYVSQGFGNETSTDGIRVTSRIYTLLPGGGTYGTALPPLNLFQSAQAGDVLEILGPVGGPEFRTNLALLDVTANAAVITTSHKVEIVDDQGAVLDTFYVPVPIAGGIQIDDLFRSRGLGDGPKAALLRITPSAGNLAAYATLIDRKTNQPMYYPAALAAK